MNFFSASMVCLMVCLMALMPLISCHPHPPSPTHPAITIKLTSKFFDLVGESMSKGMGHASGLSSPIHLSMGGKDFEGTMVQTLHPTVEIVPIPNDAGCSYEGFTNMEENHVIHHRARRSTHGHTHAKVLWEDADFLAGKEMGGIQITATNGGFNLNLTHDGHNYFVENTDCTMKFRVYIGSEEGHMKLGRIAVEVGGENKMMKEGVLLELTAEERNLRSEILAGHFISEFKKHYHTYFEHMTQVMVSEYIPHAVFDFRFTEAPKFTYSDIELNMVGQFIYDEKDEYKGKKCENVDYVLKELMNLRREGEIDAQKEGRTYEKFVLFEDSETPNTYALSTLGSDATEAERALRGCVIITIKDEVFNSFYEMILKTKMMDLQVTKDQMSGAYEIIKMFLGDEVAEEFSKLPDSTTFGFKLNDLGDMKYMTFTEDGCLENMAFGLEIGGKHADYLWHAGGKGMFRDGKIAMDLQSAYLEKTADPGFSSHLTQDRAKHALEMYLKMVNLYVFNSHMLSHISEFKNHDGYFTLGIDFKPLLD